MMKAASLAWLFLFLATLNAWLLCCNAKAYSDTSFHVRAAASIEGSRAEVMPSIHKATGASGGGRGASGGGGSISDRPEAVKKSSGTVHCLITSAMVNLCYFIGVHLF